MTVKRNFNVALFSITILLYGLMLSCSKEEGTVIQVDDIILEPTELTVIIGETKTIKYSVKPENAKVNVIWSSDDTRIAVVDDFGTVTGIKIGETNIKATVGSKSVLTEIKVVPPPVTVESIFLNEQEITATENFTLVASILPEDATNKNIIWSSNNETVATVNQEGEVTVLAEGEAIITAKTEDGGKEATCKVTVPPADVSGVVLDINNLYLTLGESTTLQATVEPLIASNKNVSWSSDNESVATVDNTGKITAVGNGYAVITVKTEDGEMTAVCNVSVSLVIFKDDFNRDDTGRYGIDNPQGMSPNWTVISGLHEIKGQYLGPNVGTGSQAAILYTAQNAITKNVGGNFSVSSDLSHGGWSGIIFNAKANDNSYSYYLFRVHAVNNQVQFLATVNNGAGWSVLQSPAVQAADFPDYEMYRINIRSVEIGKFTAIITDTSGNKIGEYALTDHIGRNYQDGYAGYWGQGDPKFDNFVLELK